jgi:hypothetical protein
MVVLVLLGIPQLAAQADPVEDVKVLEEALLELQHQRLLLVVLEEVMVQQVVVSVVQALEAKS